MSQPEKTQDGRRPVTHPAGMPAGSASGNRVVQWRGMFNRTSPPSPISLGYQAQRSWRFSRSA